MSDIALAGGPSLFVENRAGRSVAPSVLASGLLRPLARPAAPAAAPASPAWTFAVLPAVFALRFGGPGLLASAFRSAFLPLVVLLLVLVLVCVGVSMSLGVSVRLPLSFAAAFWTPAPVPPA